MIKVARLKQAPSSIDPLQQELVIISLFLRPVVIILHTKGNYVIGFSVRPARERWNDAAYNEHTVGA